MLKLDVDFETLQIIKQGLQKELDYNRLLLDLGTMSTKEFKRVSDKWDTVNDKVNKLLYEYVTGIKSD